MDSDFNLDYNDFVLMTDKTGNLTCGGFTINNNLLNNSLYNSNIQNGGANTNKDTLKQLKDLGLPAGLIFNPNSNKKNNAINYLHNSQYCDNSIYDKLLNLVDIEDKKTYSIKTKKKRDNKKKMSKKNKN